MNLKCTFVVVLPKEFKTHVFVEYVIWCGFKNGYQNDICAKEIELCAQNMITNLGSISTQLEEHI